MRTSSWSFSEKLEGLFYTSKKDLHANDFFSNHSISFPCFSLKFNVSSTNLDVSFRKFNFRIIFISSRKKTSDTAMGINESKFMSMIVLLSSQGLRDIPTKTKIEILSNRYVSQAIPQRKFAS